MRKIFLIAAVTCMSVTAVFAQKDKPGVEYRNLRGPFVTNSFGDNWFISIGAGVDTWFRPTTVDAETNKGLNKFAPVFQIGAGKMLHPNYGIRLTGSYGTVKDWTGLQGDYTHGAMGGGNGREYELKFNYWTIGADALFHFSNAVGGYKEARFYNTLLIGGVSFAQSCGEDTGEDRIRNSEFAVNLGLLNNFRLASGLDLNVELKSMIVRQAFSGNGSGLGMLPSATIGFTYKFNDRRFYTAKTAIDKAVADAGKAYDGRIRNLENELAAAEARAAQYKENANKAPETIVETITETVTEKIVEEVPLAVFFPIGKSELTDFEMLNVYYVAEVIKRNPDKVYSVIGIADKDTGTHQVNQEVSAKRAESVYKALVEKAGVDPKQVQVKAMGDRINPFELPEMNRVVIIE